MITKEENERITQVGRGTPAGEMLRREDEALAAH